MVYRLALQDGKGQIVAVQQADGGFHAHSEETRALDKDTMRTDGSLLGRRGQNVRVPSPLESAECPDEAFGDLRVVIVGADSDTAPGEPVVWIARAALGSLRPQAAK